jgi:hypothetical protein
MELRACTLLLDEHQVLDRLLSLFIAFTLFRILSVVHALQLSGYNDAHCTESNNGI